ERAELGISRAACLTGPRLPELHEVYELIRLVAFESHRLREARRHLRGAVALAVHHALEVIGRAEPGASRERPVPAAAPPFLHAAWLLVQVRVAVAVIDCVDGVARIHPPSVSCHCSQLWVLWTKYGEIFIHLYPRGYERSLAGLAANPGTCSLR